jgi:hypothetical protein
VIYELQFDIQFAMATTNAYLPACFLSKAKERNGGAFAIIRKN